MVHALRSSRVVTPEGEREAAVLIDGERIAAVLQPSELPAGVPCEDLGDVALLPGLVDTHTHINEPGRTEWEGFRTGTRAAAAGGYTTIVDMPLNCLPETTDVAALEVKRAAADGQCTVDYAFWGGAVDGNQAELMPLAKSGAAGFKSFLIYPGCEGFTSIDRANLQRALPYIAASGLPLLVHAEMAGPVEMATARLKESAADWRSYATYLASRPDEAELEAIAMLLELCRAYRFRLHIVHLSTARALPMLAAARREGLPVTVETCPHYLHFAAEDIADGATLLKCAPPIRSATNRELLWAGLLEGTIDLIATDHSPCPPEMKRLTGEGARRFDQAWGGIASLSTALPVVWTECVRRGIGLSELARWMSAAPARLAGVSGDVGAIEAGKYASLVAFDPEARVQVTPQRLIHRHPLSPYLGEVLTGAVRRTWVRGTVVFREGEFTEAAPGRELRSILQPWNSSIHADAMEAILPCNGSRAWARELAAARPFSTEESLFEASDRVWMGLPECDWNEAFASHPRIGSAAAKSASEQSLQWSSGEQHALETTASIQTELREANEAYEAKFGHIFLVCATGRSAAEILLVLKRRMGNDPRTELLEAAEQGRRITQLRLRKWLQMPPASCDEV